MAAPHNGPNRPISSGAAVRDMDEDSIGEILARIRSGSTAYISGLRGESVKLVVRMLTDQAQASGIVLAITQQGDVTAVHIADTCVEGQAKRYAA